MRSLVLASFAILFMALVAGAENRPLKRRPLAQHRKPRTSGFESVAQRFAQILAEYDAKVAAYRQARIEAEKASDKRQSSATRFPIWSPSAGMIDLAESSPAEPAARDALTWVIEQPGRSDSGAYGDEFARTLARYLFATTVTTRRRSESA